MDNLKPCGKIKLNIPFDRIIEQYNSGKMDKKLLYVTHNRIVNAIIDYFKKYITITEYMSKNKIIDDNINLYIKFDGKIYKTAKEIERNLYDYLQVYLPDNVSDDLGYPYVIGIETY